MFGRVARMSRLDCVRETLRLALQELESVTAPELRPIFWGALWERYVESQADYRASAETLGRKLGEAGTEAWQLLEWLRSPAAGERSAGPQAQLLQRVFEEQFHLVGGQPAALSAGPQTLGVGQTNAVASPGAPGAPPVPPGGETGQGPVAETVNPATLTPGEPTQNFITGIVTHPAHQSDEVGAVKMDQEQAQMGLEKPPVQYVDGAYVSAQKLAQAQAEGREIVGPAQPAPRQEGRFSVEDFQITVETRQAICPAGTANTQCSRLEEEGTGKVHFRFEFSTHGHACPLRDQCLGKDQRHRSVVVGEHHTFLQARRQEQQTDLFKARMKHRNALEGTQSELVRGHGMRRAR